MRSELTQTQVGEHNKIRREIWAAMKEKENSSGNDDSTGTIGYGKPPKRPKGFAQETADATGQTKQHINKTISRVEQVCQEARDLIRGTKAAEAEELLASIAVQVERERRQKQAASLTDTHAGVLGKNLPETKPDENKTSHQAASMFGTNRTYLNDAKKLKEESPGRRTVTRSRRAASY